MLIAWLQHAACCCDIKGRDQYAYMAADRFQEQWLSIVVYR